MPQYTVEFGTAFDRLLGELAQAKGTTRSEILRRAVATYEFLDRHVDPAVGVKVSITDRDDQVLKDVMLP